MGLSLGLLLIALNGPLAWRILHLPKPSPPPLWYERYVMTAYFAYLSAALYFAAGLLIGTMLGIWQTFGAIWLVASVGLGLVAVGIPSRRFVVRHIDIPIPRLHGSLQGLRIAQLTDLHVGPFTREKRLSKWVHACNREQPDLVVLTGDFVSHAAQGTEVLRKGLSALRAQRGIYAVLGNHDHFGESGDEVAQVLDSIQCRVLRNEHVLLTEHLAIAGVDDTWRELADVGAALETIPTRVTTVLLAHDPEVFVSVVKDDHDVQLQISGHLHGGQLAIPFLGRRGSILQAFRARYIQGLYREGAKHLYLSAGLGTTGIPMRIGMPSELPIIRLIAAQ